MKSILLVEEVAIKDVTEELKKGGYYQPRQVSYETKKGAKVRYEKDTRRYKRVNVYNRCYCTKCKKFFLDDKDLTGYTFEDYKKLSESQYEKQESDLDLEMSLLPQKNIETPGNYKCPSCNNEIGRSDVLHTNNNYVDSVNLFNDGYKITLSLAVVKYISDINNPNSLLGLVSSVRITYNLETGYTYTTIKGKACSKKINGFRNSTYSLNGLLSIADLRIKDNEVENEITKAIAEVSRAIKEYNMKKYGVKLKDISFDSIYELRSFNKLALYNRNPLVDEQYQGLVLKVNEETAIKRSKMRKLFPHNSSDTLENLVRYYIGGKDKTLKKILNTSINYKRQGFYSDLYGSVESYTKMKGKLSISNIYKVLSGDSEVYPSTIESFADIISMDVLNDRQKNRLCNIISSVDKIAKEREKKRVRDITSLEDDSIIPQCYEIGISTYQRCLEDTLNMLKIIYIHDKDYKLNLKGDIKQIHDNIVKDYVLIKDKPIDIPYEEDFNLEYETDKYIITKAVDTGELASTGKMMGICVGSYKDMALNKECTIMLLKDKETLVPICCIDVRDSRIKGYSYAVVQAKLKYNKQPKADIQLILKDWMEMYSLEANSSDLYSDNDWNEYYERKGAVLYNQITTTPSNNKLEAVN